MKQEWTEWHEKHAEKIALVAGVDCWVWQAGATPDKKHGRVSLNQRGEYAHRAAYAAYHGEMPKTGLVCHSCGVGLCVRPGHLYLGDPASNGKDMAKMGTSTGTLRPDQVTALRLDYMNGDRLHEIAERYGVAYGTVYPIVIGKAYRHVEMPPGMARAIRSPRKLSAADVSEIRRMCATGGITQSKVATLFGVRSSHISRIHSGHRHSEGFHTQRPA